MNNERNNLGVNNDLPPMGTMVDDNSENKLNLPPISSFTNFSDSNIISDNKVSENNSDVSVIDLMGQFDQVNANSNMLKENQQIPIQESSSSNFLNNLNIDVDNQLLNSNSNSRYDKATNNIPLESDMINQSKVLNAKEQQVVNNVPPVSDTINQSMMLNVNEQQVVNNVPPVSDMINQSMMSNANEQQVVNNIPPVSDTINQSMMSNANEQQVVNNIPPVSDMINQSMMLNANEQQSVERIPTLLEEQSNFNTDNQEIDKIQNVASEPMYNESNDLLSQAPLINNQLEDELISKFSMEETLNNDNNSQPVDDFVIDDNNISNNLEKNNNKIKKTKEKKKHFRNKQSKNKKLIFIILLAITIILVGIVVVICYFRFWKSDKLVCSLQGYNNDQFLLDESMVMRFKGNNLVNANFKRNLTFTETYLDMKETYLEELRNQFEGLGFDVSYSETDSGLEINMNFTKEQLENWYGTELKNSSKSNMIKEMKDVGYTCK